VRFYGTLATWTKVENRVPKENAPLVADSKTRDQSLVAFGAAATEITQQGFTALHHLQQTSARVMVLLVSLEMLRKLGNPSAQDCNLNFWRAGVRLMDPELRNNV